MPSICRRRPRYVKSFGLHRIGANNQKLELRLKSLLDKKKSVQARSSTASKLSASFITLEEGFQQFCNDLNKLQVSSLLADCTWVCFHLTRSSNLLTPIIPASRKY